MDIFKLNIVHPCSLWGIKFTSWQVEALEGHHNLLTEIYLIWKFDRYPFTAGLVKGMEALMICLLKSHLFT